MIYVLFGQPASGKTSLGKKLANHLDTPFIIDGDEFREIFSNKNYGRLGREENIKNANAVATYLNKKGARGEWSAIYCRDENGNSIKGLRLKEDTDVIMCLVNPYAELRADLKAYNEGDVVEVFLTSERELRKDYHVKDFEIGHPNHYLNTDTDIENTWAKLKKLLNL